MLSTEVFQTRSAKVVIAVVAVLLLAAFQIAVQAKPAHAYEVHLSISGAGTVDEDPTLSTQANILDPACSSSATTPTGTVGANCYPGDPNGNYGYGWVVKWKATPAAGYTFVRWESDGSATTSVKCDGANGSPTYTGTSCQFATFGNYQTRAVFADTTAPPSPTISNGPLFPVKGSASFTLSISDPTFRYFQCRVVGVHDWQTCTSPTTENPPNSGTYTLDVRAVDWSGNTGPASSWTWTVDKTAPVPTINSYPPSLTNSTSATFGFSSNEANSTFQCKIDGSAYSACSSPKTYTGLAEGAHSFNVMATDSLGNTGNSATRFWTIDLTPPNTTLTSNVGPADGSTTQDNDPVFAFTSNDTGATFECNLQGPGHTSTTFTSCASPIGYTNLDDGTYTFKVRAKDQATNVDASPAERTWTIDTVAPAVPVINSPTGGSLLGTDAFTVSGTAEANSRVELFDQGVSKGTTTTDGLGNWSKALSGVADGSHTYTAKATDAANNTSGASAPTTVTVDAKDPTVTKWTPTGKRVSALANAVAFFSEEMIGNTVEAPGTFTLKKKGSTKALGATVTYIKTTTSTGSTYKAVLNPSRNLRAGTTYVAKLTTAATDLSGNPLVAKTWTFTVKP